MHNRAYSIQHSHLAEMNSSAVVPPGSNCLFWSVDVVPRWCRPIVVSSRAAIRAAVIFSGFTRSLLEWGSLHPNLCSSLLSLVAAELSPIRNGELRLVMLRGPFRPWFEKQNLPPYLCSRCRLQPHFPFPPRLVVAPVGCAPRLDVGCTVGEVMGAWRAGRW